MQVTKIVKNESGQGLIEYLIIVALMAVAAIGIVRTLSQTVSSRFASITWALQGKEKSAPMEEVRETQLKKKDLGNFFSGSANRNGSSSNGKHED